MSTSGATMERSKTNVGTTRTEVAEHGLTMPEYLSRRIRGWEHERALNTLGVGLLRSPIKVGDGNMYPNESAVCQAYGLRWPEVAYRLCQGMSIEEALAIAPDSDGSYYIFTKDFWPKKLNSEEAKKYLADKKKASMIANERGTALERRRKEEAERLSREVERRDRAERLEKQIQLEEYLTKFEAKRLGQVLDNSKIDQDRKQFALERGRTRLIEEYVCVDPHGLTPSELEAAYALALQKEEDSVSYEPEAIMARIAAETERQKAEHERLAKLKAQKDQAAAERHKYTERLAQSTLISDISHVDLSNCKTIEGLIAEKNYLPLARLNTHQAIKDIDIKDKLLLVCSISDGIDIWAYPDGNSLRLYLAITGSGRMYDDVRKMPYSEFPARNLYWYDKGNGTYVRVLEMEYAYLQRINVDTGANKKLYAKLNRVKQVFGLANIGRLINRDDTLVLPNAIVGGAVVAARDLIDRITSIYAEAIDFAPSNMDYAGADPVGEITKLFSHLLDNYKAQLDVKLRKELDKVDCSGICSNLELEHQVAGDIERYTKLASQIHKEILDNVFSDCLAGVYGDTAQYCCELRDKETIEKKAEQEAKIANDITPTNHFIHSLFSGTVAGLVNPKSSRTIPRVRLQGPDSTGGTGKKAVPGDWRADLEAQLREATDERKAVSKNDRKFCDGRFQQLQDAVLFTPNEEKAIWRIQVISDFQSMLVGKFSSSLALEGVRSWPGCDWAKDIAKGEASYMTDVFKEAMRLTRTNPNVAADWMNRLGISQNLVAIRLWQGMSLKDAITTPVRIKEAAKRAFKVAEMFNIGSKYLEAGQGINWPNTVILANWLGMPYTQYLRRIRLFRWSPELALTWPLSQEELQTMTRYNCPMESLI